MDCRRCRNLFADYLEGKLTGGALLKFTKHKDKCPDCSRALSYASEAIKFMSGAVEQGLPRDYFKELDSKAAVTREAYTRAVKGRKQLKYSLLALASAFAVTAVMLTHDFLKQRGVSRIAFSKIEQIRKGSLRELIFQDREETARKEAMELRQREEQAQSAGKARPLEVKIEPPAKDPLLLPGMTLEKEPEIIPVFVETGTEWTGSGSGIKNRVLQAIKDEKEWRDLWNYHTRDQQPKPEVPGVDFNRNMVIALFAGERPTGGYSIRISRIKQASLQLQVFYQETAPQKKSRVIQAFTQPFHMRVIEKSAMPVTFQEGK